MRQGTEPAAPLKIEDSERERGFLARENLEREKR
jgi:hypothetical protein